METYIVTINVRPGHEDDVAEHYRSMEPGLRAAEGFGGRRIYRARPGRMAEVVRELYTAEELAGQPEAPDGEGTQFVIVEQWSDARSRIAHQKTMSAEMKAKVIPCLMPGHSHEFYTDISVD